MLTPNIRLDTVTIAYKSSLQAMSIMQASCWGRFSQQPTGSKNKPSTRLIPKKEKRGAVGGLQAMLTLNLQLCHQQIKINWNQFSQDKVSLPGWGSSAVLTAPSDETGACKLISPLKHTLKWISQNSLAGSHPGPTSWSASVNIEIW